MSTEDTRAEIADLLETVKVLRAGVRQAVDRYDELEHRLTPDYGERSLTDDELEEHLARVEVYGLDSVDVWLNAILNDVEFDRHGLMKRGGGNSWMWERAGVSPVPYSDDH